MRLRPEHLIWFYEDSVRRREEMRQAVVRRRLDERKRASTCRAPITLNLASRYWGRQLVARDSGGPHWSTTVSESSPTKRPQDASELSETRMIENFPGRELDR